MSFCVNDIRLALSHHFSNLNDALLVSSTLYVTAIRHMMRAPEVMNNQRSRESRPAFFYTRVVIALNRPLSRKS